MSKLIINAAITGCVLSQKDTPHLPVTIEEIVSCIKTLRDLGVAIVHLHARGAVVVVHHTDPRFLGNTCTRSKSSTLQTREVKPIAIAGVRSSNNRFPTGFSSFLTIKRTFLTPKMHLTGLGRFGHGRFIRTARLTRHQL